MPRKKKPKVESRGPIRVRGTYSGTWKDAYRAGNSDWCIEWFRDTERGRECFLRQCLGQVCINPLDLWIPVPDGAVGYKLYPCPEGVDSAELMPIPDLDSPDSKPPRTAPIAEPENDD